MDLSLQPKLSAPKLLELQEVLDNLGLAAQITTLVNAAFNRAKIPPEEWDTVRSRFPTASSLYDMLCENGPPAVMAIITDESAPDSEATGAPKVIACAGIIPWRGAVDGIQSVEEGGWEVKAVCVDADTKYLGTGLSTKIQYVLERWAIRKEMERQKIEGKTGIGKDDKRGVLKLWIQTVDTKAVYWAKRGYVEAWRTKMEVGTWGSKIGFDLVVAKKEVEYDIADFVGM